MACKDGLLYSQQAHKLLFVVFILLQLIPALSRHLYLHPLLALSCKRMRLTVVALQAPLGIGFPVRPNGTIQPRSYLSPMRHRSYLHLSNTNSNGSAHTQLPQSYLQGQCSCYCSEVCLDIKLLHAHAVHLLPPISESPSKHLSELRHQHHYRPIITSTNHEHHSPQHPSNLQTPDYIYHLNDPHLFYHTIYLAIKSTNVDIPPTNPPHNKSTNTSTSILLQTRS